MKNKNLTLVEFERFISKVKKEDCWLWLGVKDKDGYGTFVLRRKPRRAHRVSYEYFIGKIPINMQICHILNYI